MDKANDSADELESLQRPVKRPRLSFTPGSPEEIPEEWDLQAARAQNDNRLKSIFEGIFSKYGQDFTEVGDEIDLETGDLVVNNGHLLGLREENDTGNHTQPWLYEAGMSDDATPDEQDHDLADQSEGISAISNLAPDTAAAPDAVVEANSQPRCDAAMAHNKLSDNVDAGSIFKLRQPLEPVYEEPGPQDPLWQAPELPRMFSTPTAESRHANVASTPRLPKLTREPSPPGSGSLWAVRQPRRPRTEVKPKTTPSKSRPRAKRKHHSSPVVRDWSFAQTPDGNESDDPLQEFEPSPSPLKAKSTEIDPEPDGDDQALADNEEDDQSIVLEQGDARSDVASQAPGLQRESSETPHNSDPGLSPGHSSGKSQIEMTPDEAKVIIRMRYIQERGWDEIIDKLPARSMAEVVEWEDLHWSGRDPDSSRLSTPWSRAELITLDNLKDLLGLSWSDIRAELPDRSHAEIEFELLRLWAGHEIPDDGPSSPHMQDDVIGIHERPAHLPDPPKTAEGMVEPLSAIEKPEARASIPNEQATHGVDEAKNDIGADLPFKFASSPVKPSSNIHHGSPTPTTPSRPGFRTPKKYDFTFRF
ncbi:hypothetical protein N7512_002377 [Penicillium capsulatum]|nr:hypothetical protein N7512_002377 [Penicillium capsulatum]